MIEWIIGILVAKWWMDEEEKNKLEKYNKAPKCVKLKFPFGYAKPDESIEDLR